MKSPSTVQPGKPSPSGYSRPAVATEPAEDRFRSHAESADTKTPSAARKSKSRPEPPTQPAATAAALKPTAEETHEPLHFPVNDTVFHCDAPTAKEVLLAADFTDWDKKPIHMIRGGGGIWHVKVPLTPGQHEYRFLVDGQWRDDDSHQAHRVANAFGGFNSVVQVH